MNVLDLVLSWLLTLALHATVLLALAWGLERLGVLRHPGWRELAWRGALFGALASSLLASISPVLFPTGVPGGSPEPAAMSTPADDSAATLDRTAAVRALRATLPGESGLPRVLARPEAKPAAGQGPALPEPLGWPQLTRWQLPGQLAVVLLLAWAIGGLPVGLRLARQGWALARWTRRLPGAGPSSDSRLPGLSEELVQALRLPRAPRLRLVDGLASPMLLPGRQLLLPVWVETLAPMQQRALLAHELTHLQRHDPAWRLAQRLAVLPLYFHPLAWQALRRLEDLAEDACDERAAALCGSGRPLAECLAACLAHGADPIAPIPTLAVAMAAQPGPVVRRVKNLLEETPMRRPIPASLRRSALVIGLAAAIALPGLAITSVGNPAQAGDFLGGLFNGSSHTRFNGKDHYVHRNGRTGERIEMTLRGDVRFTDAEDDVASLAPGAEFALSMEQDGVERSLRVTPGKDQPQRDYRIDGDTHPFDDQARAWLAEALPRLLRETAIQADARGKRILERGGNEALIAEIEKIQGDHARGKYLAVLFLHAQLDEASLAKALALAGKIGSDYELRQALQAGLDNQTLAPAGQAQLLEAAAGIGSDYEQAQLLVRMAKDQALQGPVLDAWREVLVNIDSDYEQQRVLSALLARRDPAATRVALAGATGIGSDHEARKILQQATPVVRADAGARGAWFQVLAGIGSDYEQRQAIEALLDAGAVDVPLADDVLVSLQSIGSGHEAAQVLRRLAAVMPADQALIERYRAAARRLSDHERGQAERALDRFAVAVVD